MVYGELLFGGKMLILIGLGCVVLGIICGITAIGTMDYAPRWMEPWIGICGPLSFILFFGGWIVFFIGIGAYFSHPHTLHIP